MGAIGGMVGNDPSDSLDGMDGGATGELPDGEMPDGKLTDGKMIVGTPDEGTTQSATGKTDSSTYSAYDEMLEAYKSDIEEILLGDKYGNNIVSLYAPIINAPSSTKNQEKARDPKMYQTKKGNGGVLV